MTSTYLTNAGFESEVTYGSDATENHSTGGSGNSAAIDGWNVATAGSNTGAASFEYGTAATLNSVAPPTNSPYGDNAALGITVGWGSTCTYKTNDFTLPAGTYKILSHAYNANTSATYFKSLFGFVSKDGSVSQLSSKGNFASSCWNTDVVYFTLGSDTEGYIQIGGTATSGGSDKSAKLFIDGVQIVKLDQSVATPSTQTDVTYLIKEYDCMSQDNWNGSGRSTGSGAHWNGFGSSSYFTQNHESGAARTQTITLPKAGVYTLKTAVRPIKSAAYAEISFGDQKTKTSGPCGTSGGTIASDGSEWVDVATGTAANMTFAGNNAGKGWVYNTVTLVTDEDNASKAININLSNVNSDRESDCGGMQLFYTRLYIAVTASEISNIAAENSLTADKWYYVDIPAADNYSLVASSDVSDIVYTTDGNIVVEEDAAVTDALSANMSLSVGRYYIKSSSAQTLQFLSVAAAKIDLKSLIDATTIPTANVGSGVFEIPSELVSTLSSKHSTANDVYENGSATYSEVATAYSELSDAIDAVDNAELNGPAVGKKYYIKVATPDHPKANNAWLVALGNTSSSNPTGYTINANLAEQEYLCQAFEFEKVSGNSYKISIELNDEVVYLTNGTANSSTVSWKASQIQGTTEKEKAMAFIIEASDVDKAFNILNAETNSSIACQTGGNIYTESGNAYFSVEEASEASVSVEVNNGKFATRIFPFKPSAIDGITYYSCAAVDGANLTLTTVNAEDLAANTPYILEASKDVNTSLSGYGTAKQDAYTAGLLTGVYTASAITADANNYVLQTQNDKQAFYLVSGEDFTATAYRAYLTYEAGGAAPKRLNFVTESSAINDIAIEDVLNGGAIYNVAGQRMQTLQKGINIVNGKKILVK